MVVYACSKRLWEQLGSFDELDEDGDGTLTVGLTFIISPGPFRFPASLIPSVPFRLAHCVPVLHMMGVLSFV